MSARLTTEPVTVSVIRWQVDRLGYALCGDHADEARGGDVRELEARDVLRQADTEGCADDYVVTVTRELWTCDACHRHVADWPRAARACTATVEHFACRIF